MENIGEYAEEESPNTEIRQMSREPVIEEMTVHSSELMQTIKGLKTELESVKNDNEWILKTQEELNQILIVAYPLYLNVIKVWKGVENFQSRTRSKKNVFTAF